MAAEAMVAEAIAAQGALLRTDELGAADWLGLPNRIEPRDNAVQGLAVAVPISLLLWTIIGLLLWLLVR
jgi:hypothetical protein